MPRRMSCSMTVDAVRARTKTVTRRHVDTWGTLAPGDTLVLIEKGMGLPKGARQVVLATVEVVDVRVERLTLVNEHEITVEGFDPDEWTPEAWCWWWATGHGYRFPTHTPASTANVDSWLGSIRVRRIEWRYVDPQPVG